LGRSGGTCNLICSHSSSGSSGFAIVVSSMTRHRYRFNHRSSKRFC
jgi:hypothetical protein